MKVVPFVVVALLAGVAVWLAVSGHVLAGVAVAAVTLAAAGVQVWARVAAPKGAPPGGYVERERSLW